MVLWRNCKRLSIQEQENMQDVVSNEAAGISWGEGHMEPSLSD